MVRYSFRIANEEDGLNRTHYRNIRNTSKRAYNCGGYALETFSWYCPNSEQDIGIWDTFSFSKEEMERLTKHCTDFMLKDFPDMRIISSLDELKKEEYAIAFRLSGDGDFHFAKMSRNGHWYHKRGNFVRIETMTTRQIFSRCWLNRYNGPIVLFAKQRTL